MSTSKQLSDEDALTILAAYDIGDIAHVQHPSLGAGQTTRIITATSGSYVLRRYDNRTEAHVHSEAALLAFLLRHAFPVQTVVRNRSGDTITIHNEKPHMLLTFLKGTHGKNPNEHFDATTATLATHAIARLHRMSSYADPSLLGNHAVLNTHYCWREFEQRHALLVPKQAGRWVRQQLDIISLPTDLPQGICHADLNYGNFLFKDNHLTGMIDFDMSFWGPFVYDIASLIYWWAWPPHSPLNEDAARLIVREYESIRPLSEIERTHILDALALILLLSISWSDEQDFEKERIRFESLPKNLNF